MTRLSTLHSGAQGRTRDRTADHRSIQADLRRLRPHMAFVQPKRMNFSMVWHVNLLDRWFGCDRLLSVCVCDGLLRYVFDLLTTIDELPSKELYIYTL